MKTRIANISDVKVLAENNRLLALESEQVVLDPKVVVAGVESVVADSAKGFYVVATVDECIVGQLMITYEWSDWKNQQMWWIQSVYVQQQWRKKGVFIALLHAVKNLAHLRGVKLLRLYVYNKNLIAKKVYDQVGMHEKEYTIYELDIHV